MTTYSENHKTIIYGCPSCFETSEAGQWIDGKCPNCGWVEETIEQKNAKYIQEIIERRDDFLNDIKIICDDFKSRLNNEINIKLTEHESFSQEIAQKFEEIFEKEI
jgi:mevalonate kinase